MSISDKTRKILWARSGNQCAICKRELVIDATPHENDSVVAEECHIISERERGPRHDPTYLPKEKVDSYENLVLLCRVHHKMVDDQEDTYTTDILRRIKSNHEASVAKRLKARPSANALRVRRVENIPPYLFRLTTGNQVLDVVGDASACSMNHDGLRSQAEVDLVGDFLQSAQDWGEMWSELGPASRVNASFNLTQSLEELEQAGFFVFGGREVQFLEGGNQEKSSPWPVATLSVLRESNESIIRVDLGQTEEGTAQQGASPDADKPRQ